MNTKIEKKPLENLKQKQAPKDNKQKPAAQIPGKSEDKNKKDSYIKY